MGANTANYTEKTEKTEGAGTEVTGRDHRRGFRSDGEPRRCGRDRIYSPEPVEAATGALAVIEALVWPVLVLVTSTDSIL